MSSRSVPCARWRARFSPPTFSASRRVAGVLSRSCSLLPPPRTSRRRAAFAGLVPSAHLARRASRRRSPLWRPRARAPSRAPPCAHPSHRSRAPAPADRALRSRPALYLATVLISLRLRPRIRATPRASSPRGARRADRRISHVASTSPRRSAASIRPVSRTPPRRLSTLGRPPHPHHPAAPPRGPVPPAPHPGPERYAAAANLHRRSHDRRTSAPAQPPSSRTIATLAPPATSSAPPPTRGPRALTHRLPPRARYSPRPALTPPRLPRIAPRSSSPLTGPPALHARPSIHLGCRCNRRSERLVPGRTRCRSRADESVCVTWTDTLIHDERAFVLPRAARFLVY